MKHLNSYKQLITIIIVVLAITANGKDDDPTLSAKEYRCVDGGISYVNINTTKNNLIFKTRDNENFNTSFENWTHIATEKNICVSHTNNIFASFFGLGNYGINYDKYTSFCSKRGDVQHEVYFYKKSDDDAILSGVERYTYQKNETSPTVILQNLPLHCYPVDPEYFLDSVFYLQSSSGIKYAVVNPNPMDKLTRDLTSHYWNYHDRLSKIAESKSRVENLHTGESFILSVNDILKKIEKENLKIISSLKYDMADTITSPMKLLCHGLVHDRYSELFINKTDFSDGSSISSNFFHGNVLTYPRGTLFIYDSGDYFLLKRIAYSKDIFFVLHSEYNDYSVGNFPKVCRRISQGQ